MAFSFTGVASVTLIGGSVILIGGCSADLTGVRSPLRDQTVAGAATITHRTYNGKTIMLDTARKTLAMTGARTVSLDEKRVRRMVELFVRMDKFDSVLSRLEIQRERGRKTKRQRLALTSGVPAQLGSMHANASLLTAPNHVSAYVEIFDGSDLTGVGCLDIAQNIEKSNAIYQFDKRHYDEAWQDIEMLKPEDYENGVAELLWLSVDVLETELSYQLNQLNFLAVMYNSYDCWSNNWQESAPDYNVRFIPEDWLGGIGECSTQWGTVEYSVDGGLTWNDLWSGWYTDCET